MRIAMTVGWVGVQGVPAGGGAGAGGDDAEGGSKYHMSFYNENVPSFFRRCGWTPDGALLLAPTGVTPPAGWWWRLCARARACVAWRVTLGGGGACSCRVFLCARARAGQYKRDRTTDFVPTTYVYARGSWGAPAAQLPCGDKPSVVVRASPRLYELRASSRASSRAAPLPPRASAAAAAAAHAR